MFCFNPWQVYLVTHTLTTTKDLQQERRKALTWTGWRFTSLDTAWAYNILTWENPSCILGTKVIFLISSLPMMTSKEYRRFMVSISSALHEGTLLNVLTLFFYRTQTRNKKSYLRLQKICLNASRDQIFLSGKYPRIFPNFQYCTCCEKYFKDNWYNSLHLARKYARIFVRGQYPFLKPHSFPLGTLSEQIMSADRSLPRTNILAYFRAKWRLLFIHNTHDLHLLLFIPCLRKCSQ